MATALDAAGTQSITTAAGDGAAQFLIGSKGGVNENLTVDFKKMDSTTLGTSVGNMLSDKITANDNTSVNTKAKAEALITVVDDAIKLFQANVQA